MTNTTTTGWIAAITRGHNASVCLLKDGEIIFSIEEERLTRQKYDGGPLAAMLKILDYTKKLDYLVIAHTTPKETAGRIDFSGEDMYTGFARKLNLIDRKGDRFNHPQVIDLSHIHHKLHAACAFYRSGFTDAVAVVIDGAGTFLDLEHQGEVITGWETESIFECEYPMTFTTVYKHIGIREPIPGTIIKNFPGDRYGEKTTHEARIGDHAGIVKVYEAVTEFCGFTAIEAGKTMGLFPYGEKTSKIPPLFDTTGTYPTSNRNLIIPRYPNGAIINYELYDYLLDHNAQDLSTLENRRNLAYAAQTQTQEQVLQLILKAVEISGNTNVVISGGYGLNCVANYFYLDTLKEKGINLYAEPISNDAGTAIGAALLVHRSFTNNCDITHYTDNLYLGFEYNYSLADIESACAEYNAEYIDATNSDVVELLRNKHIVAMFQGKSENGPRALGNRSILFDPTFKDGKEFVNSIKRREYFRPFAGTILKDHVHEWFDLRGLDESPSMMYAVNCQDGVAEKVPSIIHVDGTCRIQTVTKDQNTHFYNLITEFYKASGVPILFNTSFNLGGVPLVETINDALHTLRHSNLTYLYLPELKKLIYIPYNLSEDN
jgi:carbamoyltransferase